MDWITIGNIFFATLAVCFTIAITATVVVIIVNMLDNTTYKTGYNKGYKNAIDKCDLAAKNAYFDTIEKIFNDLKIDNNYGARFKWYSNFLNTFRRDTDQTN